MKRQTIFIPGPLPGLNEVLKVANKRRGKWNGYDQMKKQWGQIIASVIRTSRLEPYQAATFSFVWCEKNKRRDPDNVASAKKFVLDALVSEGVVPNDGWSAVKGLEDVFSVDKENPGVYVTILEAAA